ncbi:hypothetical protein BS50DRAFT_587419 [Corynespora cassiicola Philippines]|uniref:Uncharacterized protein n=1 Tax=Corynespora cassiicola Philippines TaxID=1448308 RepID=A0A2T2NS54_CORCC|nr:hypothetical protein BS50DRAFT_587419 [Corynespora cassiicola Philippines]
MDPGKGLQDELKYLDHQRIHEQDNLFEDIQKLLQMSIKMEEDNLYQNHRETGPRIVQPETTNDVSQSSHLDQIRLRNQEPSGFCNGHTWGTEKISFPPAIPDRNPLRLVYGESLNNAVVSILRTSNETHAQDHGIQAQGRISVRTSTTVENHESENSLEKNHDMVFVPSDDRENVSNHRVSINETAHVHVRSPEQIFQNNETLNLLIRMFDEELDQRSDDDFLMYPGISGSSTDETSGSLGMDRSTLSYEHQSLSSQFTSNENFNRSKSDCSKGHRSVTSDGSHTSEGYSEGRYVTDLSFPISYTENNMSVQSKNKKRMQSLFRWPRLGFSSRRI